MNKPNKYTPDFQTFWSVYPKGRKQAKLLTFKAWLKAIQYEDPDVIIAAAAAYGLSPVGQAGKAGYVKSPSAWLNQGCWDDDPEAWTLGTPAPTFNQQKISNTIDAANSFINDTPNIRIHERNTSDAIEQKRLR